MCLSTFGQMHLDVIKPVGLALSWKISTAEDLRASIDQKLDELFAAYESKFGEAHQSRGVLEVNQLDALRPGDWVHLCHTRFYGKAQHEHPRALDVYATSGVCPHLSSSGDGPIEGRPGIQLQIRVKSL